ncbi:hypothetical protein ABID59_000124 [Bradyrhizobium sp. S3.3.6]
MAHQRNCQIDPITKSDDYDTIERLMTSFHWLEDAVCEPVAEHWPRGGPW